jgi:hypothetical protein
MHLAVGARYRRWMEIALPLYALAALFVYFRPQYWPLALEQSLGESLAPWAFWGLVGALSGVLALSGLVVAFFLLYSPVYLLLRSVPLLARRGWVDRRELRFYTACFILLCFLVGLAVWSPVVAASTFVLMAGSAHLFWRALL